MRCTGHSRTCLLDAVLEPGCVIKTGGCRGLSVHDEPEPEVGSSSLNCKSQHGNPEVACAVPLCPCCPCWTQ